MAQLLVSIFEVSLVTSAVIALFLLVSPLLERKYSAGSLCIVWLVLAFRLAVPLSFHLPQPVISIPGPIPVISNVPSAHDSDTVSTVSPGTTGPNANTPAPDTGTNSPRPTSYDAAAAVWAAGVLLFGLAHLAGYIQLRRKIRRYARPVEDQNVLELFERLRLELGVRPGRVSVLKYPAAGSPMLTGFFRPVVLLPDDTCDTGELALILRHELVHFQRRDLWFKLLLACCSTLHWFNPLVWLMAREANRQIENACDQEIVKNKDILTRKKYSETILSAMARDQAKHFSLSTYYHGGKKTMTQRFKNIFDLKTKKRGTSIVAAAVTVILISGVLVACQAQVDTGPSASPSATGASAVTDTSSPSPSAANPSDTSPDAASLAKSWAEAVKNRDGKAQYALMTKALQEKVYDEFSGLNWVTGTSSPWIVSYEAAQADGGARVTFALATSTGPAGGYYQDLTFKTEDGALKIDSISDAHDVPASETADVPSFQSLISLLGLTKDELAKALPEQGVGVDEGGLGFDKTGIRVWFDTETYTKVAQVLIMSDKIDINGARLGDSYDSFKKIFGTPVSDSNGDAHFKYGDIYLSVVRDTATDKVISVYILAENF